jgi:hypothetical protein
VGSEVQNSRIVSEGPEGCGPPRFDLSQLSISIPFQFQPDISCGVPWQLIKTVPKSVAASLLQPPALIHTPIGRLPLHIIGSRQVALYCAHRTSTVFSCAFCEQEGHLAAPSQSFRRRAFREQEDDDAELIGYRIRREAAKAQEQRH